MVAKKDPGFRRSCDIRRIGILPVWRARDVSTAPVASEAATTCIEELVLRHKLFRAAHSICSSTHRYFRVRLWCLHAPPVIYRVLLIGFPLGQMDMYSSSRLVDRMPLATDTQIGLHRYYNEVNIPLIMSIAHEIVTTFVANMSLKTRTHFAHDRFPATI